METSDTKNCYFKCSITGPLISGTRTRIISIINASKERKESLHLDLQKQLDSDANSVLYYHKQCVTLIIYIQEACTPSCPSRVALEHL